MSDLQKITDHLKSKGVEVFPLGNCVIVAKFPNGVTTALKVDACERGNRQISFSNSEIGDIGVACDGCVRGLDLSEFEGVLLDQYGPFSDLAKLRSLEPVLGEMIIQN